VTALKTSTSLQTNIPSTMQPVAGLSQEQLWASRLVDCMGQMGNQQTNSVLLALDGSKKIKPYQRYPETPYFFGDKHWRAFYHSHEADNLPQAEHGHYHFFTRANDGDEWSHVIAMGMDDYGQPTRLFTTNLWVTDGKWFFASQFMTQIAVLANSQDGALATDWLKYVLLLFQYEISDLLIARDNRVERLFPRHQEQCFLDRSVYYLSEMKINLNKQLLDIFGLQQDR